MVSRITRHSTPLEIINLLISDIHNNLIYPLSVQVGRAVRCSTCRAVIVLLTRRSYGWDFAQRLVRALSEMPEPSKAGDAPTAEAKQEARREKKREFEEPPFTAQALSEHVHKDLAGLADNSEPERRLPGLKVEDKIFVAGTAVSMLEADTPKGQIKQIINNPTAPQRHYLVCQVVSWRGELVTTVYVHIAVQGKALYVELRGTALLPCDDRFRVVDQVGGTSTKKLVREVVQAMTEAPVVVASAPISLFSACSDVLSLAFATPSASIRVTRGYDYGARVGLRELAASSGLRDHMQMQDIYKYNKIIERRVLAAILDFLEDRGGRHRVSSALFDDPQRRRDRHWRRHGQRPRGRCGQPKHPRSRGG